MADGYVKMDDGSRYSPSWSFVLRFMWYVANDARAAISYWLVTTGLIIGLGYALQHDDRTGGSGAAPMEVPTVLIAPITVHSASLVSAISTGADAMDLRDSMIAAISLALPADARRKFWTAFHKFNDCVPWATGTAFVAMQDLTTTPETAQLVAKYHVRFSARWPAMIQAIALVAHIYFIYVVPQTAVDLAESLAARSGASYDAGFFIFIFSAQSIACALMYLTNYWLYPLMEYSHNKHLVDVQARIPSSQAKVVGRSRETGTGDTGV